MLSKGRRGQTFRWSSSIRRLTPISLSRKSTADNYKAGQLAAERMGQITGGKGKIAIVAVQVGAASTMAREQGSRIRSEQVSRYSILDKRYGEAAVERASLTVAENMLTDYSDLDAMFASNESSTVGASRAIKGRGAK